MVLCSCPSCRDISLIIGLLSKKSKRLPDIHDKFMLEKFSVKRTWKFEQTAARSSDRANHKQKKCARELLALAVRWCCPKILSQPYFRTSNTVSD